jgi:serine protease SohB
MQSFSDWVQFTVSSAVVILMLTIVILLLVGIVRKKQKRDEDTITIEHLNKKWESHAERLHATLMKPKEYKAFLKEKEESEKNKDKSTDQRRRVFVINFDGDPTASQCENMREQVTAIISVARPNDEVVVRLESPGGLVQSYGLAASQIGRLRSRNIQVTAAVDKVAASGGYMIACVANRIVAAPFAFIGSIGVIVGTPNLSRFLKKHEIDYVEQTAGDNKRNVSLFGELTDEKRGKLQEQLNLIHDLFKRHVAENRPQVDLTKVANGNVWPASEALKLQLVDELNTSDDLLLNLSKTADIYLLKTEEKQDLKTKLLKKFFASIKSQLASFNQPSGLF